MILPITNCSLHIIINILLKAILPILFVLISLNVEAQNKITIEGTVSNKSGKPVIGATITVLNEAKKILSYSASNNTGYYKISLSAEGQIYVSANAIGYSRSEKEFFGNKSLHHDIKENFQLLEEAIALDEVQVLRRDIEPDSVGIKIEDLSLTENSNLHEVLSKHPAFTISDDGAILYKGKNIDKININGKAAFVNQNKIALESLEKRLIESINIQNNFRDQFTLGFEDERETLLNINTKEDMRNIAVGDAEGAYGANQKYQGKGKLLYFSKLFNSFFTHNTNNFGSLNLASREINSIFNRQSKFSISETELINGLFDQNIARSEDFRSTSTATVRFEKKSMRLHSTLYHLTNNRSAVQNIANIAPNGQSMLSQNNTDTDMYNSVFNVTSMDWKPKNNILIGYQFNAHLIRNRDSRESYIELPSGNSNNNFEIGSVGDGKSGRMSHTLSYTQRFNKRYLWNNELNYQQARIEQFNILKADYDNKQNLSTVISKISKSNIAFSTKLQYRNRLALMPWTQYQIERSNDDTFQKLEGGNDISRKMIHQMLLVGLSGQELAKYINYKAHAQLSSYNLEGKNHIFFPYKIDFSYERRLYRYYAVANKEYNMNHIDYAVNRITNYNDVNLGNSQLINTFNQSEQYIVGYAYNNMFTGKFWGISANQTVRKNILRQNFLELTDSGIRIFETKVIPNSQTFTAKVDGAIRIFSASYPITLSGDLGYQHVINTSFIGSSEFEMVQKGPTFGLKLETLSPGWLNFKIQSNANAFKVTSLNQKFDAQNIKSDFGTILRKGGFEGRLNFVYWIDNLYGNQLVRRNINFNFEYNQNNYTFGIRGRNADDFFPVFSNAAYNNYIIINQGISTLVSNNQAIRYALLFFKYRFK